MIDLSFLLRDRRVNAALDEMQTRISEKYPEATFKRYVGEDPIGVYLKAEVDLYDTDEVTDLIIDRLLEMQDEERLPIYVLPTRTQRWNQVVFEENRRKLEELNSA